MTDDKDKELEYLRGKVQKFSQALGECVLEKVDLRIENRQLKEELLAEKSKNAQQQ